MLGSKFNETELQTAQKLTKAGYYVVFPSEGSIKKIKILTGDSNPRINDVYLYDKKSFIQRKVEIKTINGGSIATIKNHIISGSGQSGILAIDIVSFTSKENVINGLRAGWSKDLKTILLNYRGQWYDLDKNKVFSRWIIDNLK